MRLTIFIVISICVSQGQQFPETPEPSVSVLVVDPQGNYLPYSVTSFKDRRTGKDFVNRFRGSHGDGIPYGPYQVTLDRPGDNFDSAQVNRALEVDKRKIYAVWRVSGVFVPGAAVSSAPPVGYRFRIQVEGKADPTRMIRIRLTSLTGSGIHDCFLESARFCEIREHLTGLYAVSVIQGKEVLQTESVSIGGAEEPDPLILTVPDKHLPVRVSK